MYKLYNKKEDSQGFEVVWIGSLGHLPAGPGVNHYRI